jgi:hypothetical protein
VARRLLYVTFDGVLQSLAFSQVVRVLVRLSERGFRYHLVSLERASDMHDVERTAGARALFRQAGIAWTPITTDLSHSVATSARALAAVLYSVARVVRSDDITTLHVRGYQAAVVAAVVSRTWGIPYVFDARGSWIDERADWFGSAAPYALGKFVERDLYNRAAAVVTLTQLHANDVINGVFGHKDAGCVSVIPTCADYDDFRLSSARPGKPLTSEFVPHDIQDRLRGRVVVAIVGSLNRSYLTAATMTVVKHAIATNRAVHLLVLTHQADAYHEALRSNGLTPDAFTITSVPHDGIARWMDWIDWGMLLLPDVAAKRGSMPTKLGEFFAAGVRPIAHGCNGEMLDWVRRARSGVVLDSLDDGSLKHAADVIARNERPVAELAEARGITQRHFSLTSGVDRYSRLLQTLGA